MFRRSVYIYRERERERGVSEIYPLELDTRQRQFPPPPPPYIMASQKRIPIFRESLLIKTIDPHMFCGYMCILS